MCSRNSFSLNSTNQSQVTPDYEFIKLAMWSNSKIGVFSNLQILWLVDL